MKTLKAVALVCCFLPVVGCSVAVSGRSVLSAGSSVTAARPAGAGALQGHGSAMSGPLHALAGVTVFHWGGLVSLMAQANWVVLSWAQPTVIAVRRKSSSHVPPLANAAILSTTWVPSSAGTGIQK
jgi:hypothetical protein